MIRIERLSERDVGRLVLYQPPYGPQQEGRVISWNNLYMFVRFNGPNGEACLPSQCSFTTYGDNQ